MKFLSPLGKIYGRAMDLRNRLYDRGTLKSYELGARTISVGNLTTGGTGKTPLVALIAKTLIAEGGKVCILTRGYGREHPKDRVLVSDGKNLLVDATNGGDEPVELALKLKGRAMIIADADRVAAAKWARERFDISVFILDDAFQHRRARRDLDIVCIDATNPCGNGGILPAGTLRESFTGVERADAVVLTRSDLVESTESIERRLRERNPRAPIFKGRNILSGLTPRENFRSRAAFDQIDGSLFAFTAIGNASNFLQTLTRSNQNVIGDMSFRDHHRFSQQDIVDIESKARSINAEALVTTAKDAVKLEKLRFELPCYVALTETAVDDEDDFMKLVRSY